MSRIDVRSDERATARTVMSRNPTGSARVATHTGNTPMRAPGSKPITTKETEASVRMVQMNAVRKPVNPSIARFSFGPARSLPTVRARCLPSREVMAPPRNATHSTRCWM